MKRKKREHRQASPTKYVRYGALASTPEEARGRKRENKRKNKKNEITYQIRILSTEGRKGREAAQENKEE